MIDKEKKRVVLSSDSGAWMSRNYSKYACLNHVPMCIVRIKKAFCALFFHTSQI